MLRKSILVTAALVGAPLAALAQGAGSVTTGPLGQPAPALGMPLLFLAAVVLAAAGVVRVRRVAGGAIAMVALAGVIALAGIGVALVPAVIVGGADCTKQTTNAFDPYQPNILRSQCPNPIKIIAIEFECENGDLRVGSGTENAVIPACAVGQTLATDDICALPECAF